MIVFFLAYIGGHHSWLVRSHLDLDVMPSYLLPKTAQQSHCCREINKVSYLAALHQLA